MTLVERKAEVPWNSKQCIRLKKDWTKKFERLEVQANGWASSEVEKFEKIEMLNFNS